MIGSQFTSRVRRLTTAGLVVGASLIAGAATTAGATSVAPATSGLAVVHRAALNPALVSWQVRVNSPGTVVRLYRAASLADYELVVEEQLAPGVHLLHWHEATVHDALVRYRATYTVSDHDEVRLVEVLCVASQLASGDLPTFAASHVDPGRHDDGAKRELASRWLDDPIARLAGDDARPAPLTPPPELAAA